MDTYCETSMSNPKLKAFRNGAIAAAALVVALGMAGCSMESGSARFVQQSPSEASSGIRILDLPEDTFKADQAAIAKKNAAFFSRIDGTGNTVSINGGAVALDIQAKADGGEMGTSTEIGSSKITYSIQTDNLLPGHIFLDEEVMPLLKGGTAHIDQQIKAAFDDVVTEEFLNSHRDLIKENPDAFADSVRQHLQETFDEKTSTVLMMAPGVIKIEKVQVDELCKNVTDLDDPHLREIPGKEVCVDASSTSTTPVGDWVAQRRPSQPQGPGVGKQPKS